MSASEDPSQVDTETLTHSLARDIDTAYRFLRQAGITIRELERRAQFRLPPVIDLKVWRVARGLTVVAAAKLIGVGRTSWLNYEANPQTTPRYVLLACQAVSAGGVGTDQANDSTVTSQSPKPDRMERSAISPSSPPPTIRPDTGDA